MSGGHLCEAEAPTEATAETLLLPLQNEDIITEIWLLSKDKFDRAANDRSYKGSRLVFTKFLYLTGGASPSPTITVNP